jgi:hypothetical protein
MTAAATCQHKHGPAAFNKTNAVTVPDEKGQKQSIKRTTSCRGRAKPLPVAAPDKGTKSKGDFIVNIGEPTEVAVAKKQAHIRAQSPTKSSMTRSRSKASTTAIEFCLIEPNEEYSDGDWEDGAMQTSRAGRSLDRRGRTRGAYPSQPRLTNIPILSSSSSESDYANATSSVASSMSGKRYERDQSPTKSLADLKLLEKPVEYALDEDTVLERVPEDIQMLWTDLRRFCKGNRYIPQTLQEHFGKTEDEDELVYDSRSAEDLGFDLRQMIAVKTQAHKIQDNNETQWYCSVHWPILTAAFHDQPTIEPTVVTHARPIKEFLPKIGKQYTESKLIDLAVNLIPPSSTYIMQ